MVKLTDGTENRDRHALELAGSGTHRVRVGAFVLATIHVPTDYLGGVLALCEDKRGVQRELKFRRSLAPWSSTIFR